MEASLPVFPNGCAVIVVRNYNKPLYAAEVLIGKRHDGQGWGFPGGGIEEGEMPISAVARELKEEFGLTAKNLEFIGQGSSIASARGNESVVLDQCFLCTDFEGDVVTQEGEIDDYAWVKIPHLYQMPDLFKPTWDDLLLLNQYHAKNCRDWR